MKILIVKTSSLGDIIHAYPVLSYLKKHFPEASIDFVVEKPFAELVANHPFVNDVIEVDTKQWRKKISSFFKGVSSFRKTLRSQTYDVCFDLQCNLKSGLIVAQVKAKHKVGFGFKTAIEWPNCFFNRIRFNPPKACNVREENLFLVEEYFRLKSGTIENANLQIGDHEKEHIEKLMQPLLNPTKIMVCPGSIWQNKQITKETMIEFLKKVEAHKNCSFLFIWGSLKEKEYAEDLQANFTANSVVVERLSLSALQNLMSHMQLVIAMDSLPLHLAGTTNTPTFSFFGPSSSAKFMPMGKQHHAFQGTCPYGKIIQRRCPIIRTCKTGACLRSISSDVLFDAFLNV